MLTTLLAMQHADTAFPSGAFAFSNGVEGVGALPFSFEVDDVRRLVDTTLRHRWYGTDRVALVFAYRTGMNCDRLITVDRAVNAATLPKTLRDGSTRAGRALLASHIRLKTPDATELRVAIKEQRLIGHLPIIQGVLWRGIGLDEPAAIALSGYLTISGMVSAAVRLGRIGALDAQTIVRDALPTVANFVQEEVEEELAVDPDRLTLHSFMPFMEIGAMRSDAANMRLFGN